MEELALSGEADKSQPTLSMVSCWALPATGHAVAPPKQRDELATVYSSG